MNVNYYEKFNLKEVINASGKMTILGVSKVSDHVLEAQKIGGKSFFEMDELMLQTGAYIAKILGVADAHIVSCASAGIAQSVAAVIGKGSIKHVYRPYDPLVTDVREIILPKGHNIDYGTPVELMIAQGGGHVVEAGYGNMCTSEHIEMMITEKTAAIFYVKSHHAVQKSMLTVKEAIEVAKKYQLPLIVDAAAEEDLHAYMNLGADLVIYSGAKALNGPSSGLVLGKKTYIEWVRLQGKGLGRSMKIGKDNILGHVGAIEDYLQDGAETGASMKLRLEPFVINLNKMPNIEAKIVQDASGRDIYRASVKVTGALTAKEVVMMQKQKSPAIYTREYQVNQGIIEYDIRSIDETEMEKVIQRLTEIMKSEE